MTTILARTPTPLPLGWSEHYDSRKHLRFYICNTIPSAPYATSTHPEELQQSRIKPTEIHLWNNTNPNPSTSPPHVRNGIKDVWWKRLFSGGPMFHLSAESVTDIHKPPSKLHRRNARPASDLPVYPLAAVSVDHQPSTLSSSTNALPLPLNETTSYNHNHILTPQTRPANGVSKPIHTPGSSSLIDFSVHEAARPGEMRMDTSFLSVESFPRSETKLLPAVPVETSAHACKSPHSSSLTSSIENLWRDHETPTSQIAQDTAGSQSQTPPATETPLPVNNDPSTVPPQPLHPPSLPALSLSNHQTSSPYQSEVSRGKRPMRQCSLNSMVGSQTSIQRDAILASSNNVSIDTVPLPDAPVPGSPEIVVLVPTPPLEPQLYLDEQLTEMKHSNELVLVQITELGTRLRVLEAGLQLLSSFEGRHVQTLSKRLQSYSETDMKEKTAKFLGAAHELLVATEEQAVWLADQIDAQDTPTPLEDHVIEASESTKPLPVFLCGICLEEHLEEDAIRIDDFEHTFCQACLRSYIISKIKEHRYPISCPTCAVSKVEGDPKTISHELILRIGIPDQDLTRLEELELSIHSVPWHCHNCEQSMLIDKQDYLDCGTITCPVPGCDHVWCKLCGQEIRVNVQHSCDGSCELDELMKRNGWKYCPGCLSPVQKESGCNHLICISPGCNTHFCYFCGDKIVQSVTSREIEEFVQVHYRKCTIIENLLDQDMNDFAIDDDIDGGEFGEDDPILPHEDEMDNGIEYDGDELDFEDEGSYIYEDSVG